MIILSLGMVFGSSGPRSGLGELGWESRYPGPVSRWRDRDHAQFTHDFVQGEGEVAMAEVSL
jgi:hypothetical protein